MQFEAIFLDVAADGLGRAENLLAKSPVWGIWDSAHDNVDGP
jgi:hypothetical protein